MKRRRFLKGCTAALAITGLRGAQLLGELGAGWVDLKQVMIVLPKSHSRREETAAELAIEEVRNHCGLDWVRGEQGGSGDVTLYLGTRDSWHSVDKRTGGISAKVAKLKADSFAIASGSDSHGSWIAICGSDERGLIFGVGKFLRSCEFGRWSVRIASQELNLVSSPRYPIRGHQLGYRPKTNAYDAWTVAMWDQYIRELAIFGTNAIEILPPISDDLADSPHFPLPPQRMMIEMSRIADKYGLDVWIWYPAMAADYGDPKTVELELAAWGEVVRLLPRADVVFVPGGDPGHTEPKNLLPFLEKQKKNLQRYHPKLQMWMSPQSFNAAWTEEFLSMVKLPSTQAWLDGVVFGPQNRMDLADLRKALPQKYPIRFYPDITHSLQAQYSMNNWDIAYALTEGREIINPRPQAQAEILRSTLPLTSGFISYSEGCNDDVNKFVWSLLAWDPDMSVAAALRDFGHYFIGAEHGSAYGQGLLNLERNWDGPLAANNLVDVTLSQFQEIERDATPMLLENWRWQQAMFRACCDAYVRQRLLHEAGEYARARSMLARIEDLGWAAVALGIGGKPSLAPPNGHNPQTLIDGASQILRDIELMPVAQTLRTHIGELGYALLQSIHMQLSVERYQGEAVDRGAPIDTIDHPVTDAPWLLSQLESICTLAGQEEKVVAIRALLNRTNPGAGGFYDELGNVGNRPHLVLENVANDYDFRRSVHVGTSYPDQWGSKIPMAWKHWAETLYEQPLQMHYTGLDPEMEYTLQVVYSGDARAIKLKLIANETVEIHPFIARTWPPAPQKFSVPKAATAGTELRLTWTSEGGLGGNGRGCEVAEVWLMPVRKDSN